MLRNLLIILLLFLPLFGHTNETAWLLKREESGIRIYQQSTDSGYALTRGEVEIPASLDALLAVMRDPAACPQWVYACKQSTLVQQYDPAQRLDYTVIDSPLWFADRDMYIHSSASFDRQSKTFRVQLTGKENYAETRAGRVRINHLYGSWKLQQTEANKTSLSYQLHGNPQLPASSLLDAYMVESVFQTLSNLGRLAQETRPQKAWVPELH